MLPSVYLAYRLAQEEIFVASAQRFIKENVAGREGMTLVLSDVDPKQRSVVLTMFGERVTAAFVQDLNRKLAAGELVDTTLTVRHPSEASIDMSRLQGVVAATKDNAARIAILEARNARKATAVIDTAALEAEILALHPGLQMFKVTTASQPESGATGRVMLLLAVEPQKGFSADDSARIKRWLMARFPDAEINVVIGRFS